MQRGSRGLFPLLASWTLPRALGASDVLPLASAPSQERPYLTPPDSELTGVPLTASTQPLHVFTPRQVDTVGVFTPFLCEPDLLHQEPVIKDLIARLFSGLFFREKQPELLISLALPMPPQFRVAGSIPDQGANIPPASWPNTQNRSNVMTNSIKTKNGPYKKHGFKKKVSTIGREEVILLQII